MLKKMVVIFTALVILATSGLPLFLSSSCTFSHLKLVEPSEDEVTQFLCSAPSIESYPDAGIINILNEKIEEVFENGRSKETFHTVFKIINERGKDYADIEIGYNSHTETASILYARTMTPEGKIIPLKKNAVKIITPFEKYPSYNDYKKLTFSMPGAVTGSIIDYMVVREEKKPTIEGKFSSHYYFQEFSPTLTSRYKVIIPKGINLKYFFLNPPKDVQLSPKIIPEEGKEIYIWEYKNIPQIIREDSMPPFDEVAFSIMVTNMGSWEEFSHWWRKNIEGKTAPNRAIKEKVAELTKNLSTFEEKLEAIFDYVKREIRYVSIDLGKSGYEPAPAPEVFENKYGDCKDKSTLLISMLKAAGINAHYVLIPTNDMGNLVKDFPYPFQFNHCIASVEREGGYHFIDPVAENYQIDYLPSSDQNRDVLIFKDQKIIFAKTPLAKPEENASSSHQKIMIETDGSIKVEFEDSLSGDKEASFRQFFIDYSPTEIKEALEKRVDKISPGAKLVEYTHSDPLNFKEKFVLNIKYYAQDYCKKAGDILIFQVPEIEQSCGVTAKKERRYPIVFWTHSYSKEEVEFNIPVGYEVYFLPEPVEVINQYFEFRSNYRRDGDRIFYRGEFINKAINIAPEDYPFYYKFCQVVGKSSKREVLFRKKS